MYTLQSTASQYSSIATSTISENQRLLFLESGAVALPHRVTCNNLLPFLSHDDLRVKDLEGQRGTGSIVDRGRVTLYCGVYSVVDKVIRWPCTVNIIKLKLPSFFFSINGFLFNKFHQYCINKLIVLNSYTPSPTKQQCIIQTIKCDTGIISTQENIYLQWTTVICSFCNL